MSEEIKKEDNNDVIKTPSSSSSSLPSSPKKSRSTKRKKIMVNVQHCKYSVVKKCSQSMGYTNVDDETPEWNLLWSDSSLPIEKYSTLQSWQLVNHLPGMVELTRKDNLARNLQRMQKLFPSEYAFFPRSWILPTEWSSLRSYYQSAIEKQKEESKKSKTNNLPVFIVKPDNNSQGRGIFLINSLDNLNSSSDLIVQEYLSNPFLIDGYKFDMRIYVLITCPDPLRVMIYKDGLARFATEKYDAPCDKNINQVFMHLTNYSLNQYSENFVVDEDPNVWSNSSKRSVLQLGNFLNSQGINFDEIWRDIEQLVVKTILMIQPRLAHLYHTCFPSQTEVETCFELLGFDVFLTQTGDTIKPWLLEVNLSPSLNLDTPLDKAIKPKVISDTLKIINVQEKKKRKPYYSETTVQGEGSEKDNADKETNFSSTIFRKGKLDAEERELLSQRKLKAQEARWTHEEKNLGGFKLIYPSQDMQEYQRFLVNPAIFSDTVASLARKEMIQKKLEEQELARLSDLNKRPKPVKTPTPKLSETNFDQGEDRLNSRTPIITPLLIPPPRVFVPMPPPKVAYPLSVASLQFFTPEFTEETSFDNNVKKVQERGGRFGMLKPGGVNGFFGFVGSLKKKEPSPSFSPQTSSDRSYHSGYRSSSAMSEKNSDGNNTNSEKPHGTYFTHSSSPTKYHLVKSFSAPHKIRRDSNFETNSSEKTTTKVDVSDKVGFHQYLTQQSIFPPLSITNSNVHTQQITLPALSSSQSPNKEIMHHYHSHKPLKFIPPSYPSQHNNNHHHHHNNNNHNNHNSATTPLLSIKGITPPISYKPD